MKLTNKLIQKKNNYVRPNTSAILFKNKYFLFLKINFICIKQKKIINELAKHLELKKTILKKNKCKAIRSYEAESLTNQISKDEISKKSNYVK
jgi:hypothetical protein